MCSIYTQLSIRGSKNINSLQIKGRWFPSFHCSICIPPLICRGCVYFVRKMWTYDCFQGFYTNWRVSRENIIYAILVGNENVHWCANNYWSTLHTSSCIENMEINITSSMPSLCEIKIYSCANHYCAERRFLQPSVRLKSNYVLNA